MTTTKVPLSLVLPEMLPMYLSYMPFVEHGGVFIKTSESYDLGQHVEVELSLMGETSCQVPGRVVWINPPGNSSIHPQGVGVAFDDTPSNKEIREKMEVLLADVLGAPRPTHTL